MEKHGWVGEIAPSLGQLSVQKGHQARHQLYCFEHARVYEVGYNPVVSQLLTGSFTTQDRSLTLGPYLCQRCLRQRFQMHLQHLNPL